MIAHPQEVYSYHLILSILLLLLTIYPVLFTGHGNFVVSAYSSDDFQLSHNLISKFDIIDSNEISFLRPRRVSIRSAEQLNGGYDREELLLHDNKEEQRVRRIREGKEGDHAIADAGDPPTRSNEKESNINRVEFFSLGRKFNLVFNSRPAHLVTNSFTVVTLDADGKSTKVPYNYDADADVMDGYLDNDPQSRVTAFFDRRTQLMTAQIQTAQNDIIIVEPTYLHRNDLVKPPTNTSSSPLAKSFKSSGERIDDSTGDQVNPSTGLNTKLYNETMIVYNLSDHMQFNNSLASQLFKPETLCAALKLNNISSEVLTAEQNNVRNSRLDDIYKIYKPQRKYEKKVDKLGKRSIEYLAEQAKDKTRCTLHIVADYLFYLNVGRGDRHTTVNYILALINRVNQIYLPTIWETGDDGFPTFSNIGFSIENITIHDEYTRTPSDDIHYNMAGDRVWAAREFLDNFSRFSPQNNYCLAHLLTYRKFDSPVLGLAYVAAPRFGQIGGICSPPQYKGDKSYKHNTGISTSKGISGETLITRQADLVLAHELGHNLGAEHDTSECRPASTSGGAFLMHPFAVLGFERNNRFLSNCSRLSIGRVLKKKASSCFLGVVNDICGNGIVEGDEECDGGYLGWGHNDPCCDSSCRFIPGARCSDRHSWCCNKCQIMPFGIQCRRPEEFNCKKASSCDGNSAECPDSPPADDDTVCVARGLCRDGDCKPFCEARELHSCLCREPQNACKLCCKTTPNSTCVPYDENAPALQDGVLCYNGVCENKRCEQPIQDAVERLWDVLEDVNFTTIVKFLRDNIIIVVLVVTIPLWCLATHFINQFDRQIRDDVLTAIMRQRARFNGRKRSTAHPSPFLPRLFVGDDLSNNDRSSLNSADDIAYRSANDGEGYEAVNLSSRPEVTRV